MSPEAKPLRIAPWKAEGANLKAMAMSIFTELGPDRTEKLIGLLKDKLAEQKSRGKWIDEEGKGTAHRPKEAERPPAEG